MIAKIGDNIIVNIIQQFNMLLLNFELSNFVDQIMEQNKTFSPRKSEIGSFPRG